MAGTLTISTLNNDTGVLATQNGMSGIAKAWANFTGSNATVNGSMNIGSITKNSTALYYVTFATAMPNANYAITVSTWQSTSTNNVSQNPNTLSTNGFFVTTNENGAGTDATRVFIAVFSA